MPATLASLVDLAAEARRQIGEGRLQRGMALLTALGALGNGVEAYIEHHRGSYRNRWMWTPVVISPLAGVVALAAVFSRRAARTLLPWASLVLFADGMVGTVLHFRGIRNRPGNLKLGTYNFTMGPPLFAPFLLGSVGFLGLVTAYLRREQLGSEVHEL